MLASLSNQPDVKAYISEQDTLLLAEKGILSGKIYLHTRNAVGTLLITVDGNLKNGAKRLYDDLGENEVSIALSPEIRDEFLQEGFIGGMRMNGTTQKITLVLRERISRLKISSDDKLDLEWGLDGLIRKLELC